MRDVPEFVYNRLLSMGDDEFQREYTYIYSVTSLSPDAMTYFGGTFGWNLLEHTHPLSDNIHQTTIEEAMDIMEEAKRLRAL